MAENIIYCFSGTGNCLDMARNIARELGGADIVMLRKNMTLTDAREARRVGFVFPCHGGGLPGGVEELLKNIRVSPNAYKFAVCLCSVYPGTGLSVVNRIFVLDYWQVVTHHCSCVWLFPHGVMMPPLSVEGAQARAEREAKRIGAAVKAGEKMEKAPGANPLNLAENKAWGSIAKHQSKRFRVSSMCIGCGTCARVCPRGNIRLKDGRAVIGEDCVQCLSCLQYCPQEAISIGKITQKREHYHNPNVTAADLSRPEVHIGG